jgi:putative nucleotidyltransferase with HDIG domain
MKHKKVQQLNLNSISTKLDKPKDDSYLLVDKRVFHTGDTLDFNLYSANDKTQMTLYLQSDTVLDINKKKRLRELEQLFILNTQRANYDMFLEEHIQDIVDEESLSIDEKTDLIYQSSTELTEALYNNPNALGNAKRSENIVMPVLQSIIHHQNTIQSYMKIIEHDYYTHTHSLNVSIYALSLGATLKLDEKTLKTLGRAALLHDLGKSDIDYDIINKVGKLSEFEFEEIKKHPTFGYEIALKLGISDKDTLDGIRHHHEKLDGMGYPDKIKGDEITLFPRIIGICDVFDALTTKRSYKDPMSSFEALMIMKEEMKTHLDTKLLKTFIQMLHS